MCSWGMGMGTDHSIEVCVRSSQTTLRPALLIMSLVGGQHVHGALERVAPYDPHGLRAFDASVSATRTLATEAEGR